MSESDLPSQIPGFKGPASATEPAEAHLRTGALGLRAVIFQNMTNMAPAAAIVYDFPAQIAAAGAALWLSNSIALFAVLLIASSIIQFARRLPHAGGYYTYLSRSLGPQVGAFSAWIYFLYALILPAEVTLIWAGIASDLLKQYGHITIPWWIFEVGILGLVTYLVYAGVQRSARITMIAGALEITIFLILAVALLIKPASPINFSQLAPSHAPIGWSGILGFGLVYGILNFVGFESAAPMAEETADPRRNIPRSVLYSVLIMGTVYLLMSIATVFGWGIPDLVNLINDPSPFNTMANRVLGIGTLLIFLAATNSSFGCALATINQGSRVLMSMGRNGLISPRASQVHPQYGTPHVAALIIGGTTTFAALAAGFTWGTVNGFYVLAATLTDGALLIYILGNIGLPVFYRREHREHFRLLTHIVMPLMAILLLGYVFYRTLWPIPVYPLNLPGYFAIFWVVVGIVLVAIAQKTRAEGLRHALEEEVGV